MAWDDWDYLSLREILILIGCCCALQGLIAVVTLPSLLIHYAIVRPIGLIVKGVQRCHKKVVHRVDPAEEVEDIESGEPAEE